MNRFNDALAIQQGASNPSGVARSLVRAIDQARDEGLDTEGIKADPACRLICHQLAFLLGVPALDTHLTEYCRLIDVCEARK